MFRTPLRVGSSFGSSKLYRGALTCALAALSVSTAQAETLTVGPAGSGCRFTDITGAIIRAAITAEDDLIAVAADLSYTGNNPLALVAEEAVTLRGVASCTDTDTRVERTITLTRSGLFAFNATDLFLQSVRIENTSSSGRPLFMEGGAVLVLDQATVRGGRGLVGGNIQLVGGSSLFLFFGSRVEFGTATLEGGGVYCSGEGAVTLFSGSRVAFNETGGNGGGIHAVTCRVNVFSGGDSPIELGLFSNGALGRGGGIYARGGADVFLGNNAGAPASLLDNLAGEVGGGLAAEGASTIVTLRNAEIRLNRAVERGGGIYVGANATLEMEQTQTSCTGRPCSFIAQNRALGGTAGEGFGGAVAVEGGASARIYQTHFTENTALAGGRVADVSGAGSLLVLEGAVLHDNDSTGVQIRAHDQGQATLAYSSAWGSSTPGDAMAFLGAESSGQINLRGSIIIEGNGDAPGGGGGVDRVFAPLGAGAIHSADCVIAHEIASLPGATFTYMVETNPAAIWANPGAGDAHLTANSGAIDYCDSLFYNPMKPDIDGEPRGRDITHPNFLGRFDLGADEAGGALSQEIFSDDFESGTTRAWSSRVP